MTVLLQRTWAYGIFESRKGRKSPRERVDARTSAKTTFAKSYRLLHRKPLLGELPTLTQEQSSGGIQDGNDRDKWSLVPQLG